MEGTNLKRLLDKLYLRSSNSLKQSKKSDNKQFTQDLINEFYSDSEFEDLIDWNHNDYVFNENSDDQFSDTIGKHTNHDHEENFKGDVGTTTTAKLRHRTRQNYISLKNKAWKPIDIIKFKIQYRISKLDDSLQTIFFNDINKLEKLFYPFTLSNILLIGIIMNKFPNCFHIYYTILFCFLIPMRFYIYYKQNNHYFMADLCYFVNFMCLTFIWIKPNSQKLFQSCFALTFGSLSFAVITWRNSLVLHSIDKTTSCFIHIIPPIAMYVIYWALDDDFRLQRFPGAIHTTIDLKFNIIWTSIYYLVWQLLYHYFITLRKSQKIKSGQRMTSFEYLTKHQFKDLWCVKLPAPFPMIIYTLLQYFYQLFTMLLCVIWLRYRLPALIFLFSIFLTASYNGATYYIDVYGKHFENQLVKLKQELEILQDELKIYRTESNNSIDNGKNTDKKFNDIDANNQDQNEYIINDNESIQSINSEFQ